MDNQNILRIVLSLAIIVAFFLPLYNDTVYGSEVSSWQVLTNSFDSAAGDSHLSVNPGVLMVCLLVVLICIVIILTASLLRKVTSVLLNLLPLLSIIALIVFSMTQAQEGENVGQTLQAFGTGFYIMFLSSFLLPFTSIAVNTQTNN